jgi:hypothetical protein
MVCRVLFLFQHHIPIALKYLLKSMECAVLKRLHGPFGSPKRVGDLLIGHIGEKLQRQHLLLIFGQLGYRLLERHPVEDRMNRILPAWVG